MLQQSEQLLSMHANRANSVWADKRSWDSGQAVGLQEQSYFKSSEDFAIYKADLVRMLRRGQVVFQFFAAEDDLLLPGGTYQVLGSTFRTFNDPIFIPYDTYIFISAILCDFLHN